MKIKKIIFLCSAILIAVSCNVSNNHKHDGSYSLSIIAFGVNMNSKVNLIINGDKMKYDGKIIDCQQYSDRVEVGEGKVIFNAIDGDLIVNLTLGKAKYIRISEDNDLNK